MDQSRSEKKKIVVGVSGSSGVITAQRFLRCLAENENVETHVVISDSARLSWKHEVGTDIAELESLADFVYDCADVAARISSGSFRTDGMVVLPCSMKTVAGIASGYSDNLLLRAADVVMKEQRRLILAVRETPLSPVHLRNMYELSKFGVMILPMMMSYYGAPKSIEDMENQFLGKILDALGIENTLIRRWNGRNDGEHI